MDPIERNKHKYPLNLLSPIPFTLINRGVTLKKLHAETVLSKVQQSSAIYPFSPNIHNAHSRYLFVHSKLFMSSFLNSFIYHCDGSIKTSPCNSIIENSSIAQQQVVDNKRHHKHSTLLAGLVSGVLVAGLFNPWDRALYLSMLYERPFFDKCNWVNPYKGFVQVIVQRTLSGGSYYPLFDLFKTPISQFFDKFPNMQSTHKGILISFFAGNAAGALSGILLNPLNAVKFASWNNEVAFGHTVSKMWHEGGVRPFVNGIKITVIRDTTFGGIFSTSKYLINIYTKRENDSKHRRQLKDFASSMSAAAIATTLSSPLNFIRNIQYGTPSHQKSESGYQILRELWTDIQDHHRKFSYVQNRLRIGWGTLRVAIGMAVGYEIYEEVKAVLENTDIEHRIFHSWHTRKLDT